MQFVTILEILGVLHSLMQRRNMFTGGDQRTLSLLLLLHCPLTGDFPVPQSVTRQRRSSNKLTRASL